MLQRKAHLNKIQSKESPIYEAHAQLLIDSKIKSDLGKCRVNYDN